MKRTLYVQVLPHGHRPTANGWSIWKIEKYTQEHAAVAAHGFAFRNGFLSDANGPHYQDIDVFYYTEGTPRHANGMPMIVHVATARFVKEAAP